MHKWKNELRQAFDTPCPVRKEEFLRQLDMPVMPVHEFLISQIGYIRKWVWCISLMILITILVGFLFLPDTVIWFIFGLTPILAITIVSESGRSEFYKMAELEMATRFSLRSVAFARLIILGLMNLMILGVFIVIGLWNNTSIPLATVLYIVTPFLLTAYSGLYIVRRFRGQEAMYACVGISVGISVFLFLSRNIIPFIYQEKCLVIWMITALVLLWGNGKQCVAMIKQTEELTWNLS